MITCLTREEYDESLSRHLGDFARTAAGLVDLAITDPAAWAHFTFCHQYPKTGDMAVIEMRHRGVLAPDLPSRSWEAGEIDGAIVVLESLGMLTDEAREAAAAGVSLSAWRSR